MKICLINYEYPPFPAGGIATYSGLTAGLLAKAGHEVHVVTNRASFGGDPLPPHKTEAMGNGVLHTHRLDLFDEKFCPPEGGFMDLSRPEHGHGEGIWATDSSATASLQIADYVQKLHEEEGLDLIESSDMFAETFFLQRRSAAGAHDLPPVILKCHTSSRRTFEIGRDPYLLGDPQLRERMAREDWCIANAGGLEELSGSLAKYYQRVLTHLPEIREQIPNPIEKPKPGFRCPRDLRHLRPYLLVIGRLEARKGTDLAVEAFAKIAGSRPDLRLLLLGEPDHWRCNESFEEFLSTFDDDTRARIVQMDPVPRAKVFQIARHATAALHPARWDNWPFAVLEAMAVGTPCVVSDCGGHAEMIEDGVSGLIHRSEDAGALADAVERILDDRGLARKIGRGAKRRVKQLSDNSRITKSKEKLYSRIIGHSRQHQHKASGGIILIDGHPEDLSPDSLPHAARQAVETWQPEWRGVLAGSGRDSELPPGWSQRAFGPQVWNALDPNQHVVWLMSGAELTREGIDQLRRLAEGSPKSAGAFAWLSHPEPEPFPYRADFGLQDLLHEATILPKAFCVAAHHLQCCTHLNGMDTPEQRGLAIMAVAAARGGMFLHTGTICGTDPTPQPTICPEMQRRAIGFLLSLDLLPRSSDRYGTQ